VPSGAPLARKAQPTLSPQRPSPTVATLPSHRQSRQAHGTRLQRSGSASGSGLQQAIASAPHVQPAARSPTPRAVLRLCARGIDRGPRYLPPAAPRSLQTGQHDDRGQVVAVTVTVTMRGRVRVQGEGPRPASIAGRAPKRSESSCRISRPRMM